MAVTKKSFAPPQKEPINTFKKKDKEHELIKHLKRGRSEMPAELKKTNKKTIGFTDQELEELEKVKKILNLKTDNAVIYKLIELGLENFNIR